MHIQSAAQYVPLSPVERDTATLAVIRLNPQAARNGYYLNEVSDLRKLWETVSAARRSAPPPTPPSLYVLTASRTTVEKQEDLMTEQSGIRIPPNLSKKRLERYGMGRYVLEEFGPFPYPSEILAEHRVLSGIGSIIDSSIQQ